MFCQVNQRLPVSNPPDLDVVFVIDSSPAMGAYADKVSAFMTDFADVFESLVSRPSLQIAFTSASNTLGGLLGESCTSDGLPFAYVFLDSWWRCGDNRSARCGVANDQGELASTLQCMAAQGESANAQPTPLAALSALMGNDGAGRELLRPRSVVLIVVISSADDASVGGVDDLAVGFGDRWVIQSAIAPLGSERLESFVDGTREGQFVDIDRDWFEVLRPFAETLPEPPVGLSLATH